MNQKHKMNTLISPMYLQNNPYAIDNIGLCVYFISDGEYTKIGIAESLQKRLKGLQTANARKLYPLYVVKVNRPAEAHALEIKLHKFFRDKNTIGEWFDITEDDIMDAKRELKLAIRKPYFPEKEMSA